MNDENDGRAKSPGISMSTLKKYFKVQPRERSCYYGKHLKNLYTLTCLDCGKSVNYCPGEFKTISQVQKAIHGKNTHSFRIIPSSMYKKLGLKKVSKKEYLSMASKAKKRNSLNPYLVKMKISKSTHKKIKKYFSKSGKRSKSKSKKALKKKSGKKSKGKKKALKKKSGKSKGKKKALKKKSGKKSKGGKSKGGKSKRGKSKGKKASKSKRR
jgi:hypothetical protein